MVKIAVMGHGVVGSGVVEVFYKNRESIQKKADCQMDIAHILDLRDFPDSPYKEKFTKSFDDIINDDEVKIVVEVMGGVNPAYDFVKRCLLKGKSVATSNKELVATKGAELLKIAGETGTNFLFEASVGGGIPILRPLSQCLAANDIIEIDGILNGTTNYILTKMIKEQVAFSDALKNAQELGYAERDPSADIEGADACRKICILASLSYGKHVYPDEVYTEGITKISLTDVAYAESMNSVIKLIGRSKKLKNGKVTATVYPAIISKDCQLANVDDVYNAVCVKGDAIGDVVFYGKGAGKLPTASAVVADVIDCAKHIHARKLINWEDRSDDYVEEYKNDVLSKYIRMTSNDIESLKNSLKQQFNDIQFLTLKDADENEIAFTTGELMEKVIDEKLSAVADMGEIVSSIRILNI
ncbi:MAG: homoserine dehydrogenase [Clostridia bacterium]|nr:homoserine dehydrogenase [Clostridia bacterium]